MPMKERLPIEAMGMRSRGGLAGQLHIWGGKDPGGVHQANTFQGTFLVNNNKEDGWDLSCLVKSYPPNPYGLTKCQACLGGSPDGTAPRLPVSRRETHLALGCLVLTSERGVPKRYPRRILPLRGLVLHQLPSRQSRPLRPHDRAQLTGRPRTPSRKTPCREPGGNVMTASLRRHRRNPAFHLFLTPFADSLGSSGVCSLSRHRCQIGVPRRHPHPLGKGFLGKQSAPAEQGGHQTRATAGTTMLSSRLSLLGLLFPAFSGASPASFSAFSSFSFFAFLASSCPLFPPPPAPSQWVGRAETLTRGFMPSTSPQSPSPPSLPPRRGIQGDDLMPTIAWSWEPGSHLRWPSCSGRPASCRCCRLGCLF